MYPQVCLFLLVLIECYGYRDHWGNYNQEKNLIPQDVMVQVVNDLALKLLAAHNEGNENNIAVSPYGVVSVLVALEEGLQGDASYEIEKYIPADDIRVIRIGLRDIHRHLKSYFIPDEGFLSGLTFSHNNVTLKSEYEDILKFYGFDINSFNSVFYGDLTTQTYSTTDRMTTETSTTTSETTEMTTTTFEVPTTVVSTTEAPESTIEPRIENTETPSTSTMESSTITTAERVTTPTVFTTTKQLETSTKVSTLPTIVESTTQKESTISDESTTTTESTTMSTSTEKEGTTFGSSTAREEVPSTTNRDTGTEENENMMMSEAVPTIDKDLVEIFDVNGTFDSSSEAASTSSTTTVLTGTTKEVEMTTESKNDETLSRNTRSVVDYIIARYYDDHHMTQRPPPPYISNNDLYFLINGKYKETNISYMTYDTVLPFHYISHLNTKALRFPLDSSKYYLLLLLPEDPTQIDKLICDLRLRTSLHNIINKLRLTHVKAIIPSFMLKGFVILTPTLQKMGIRRVFEPRQADFSPMTDDRGLYVTNIEQAITVNIRNYVDSASLDNFRYLQGNIPALFRADHPFLYFVIDSEIHVTLMMGKIVNPLNSRIR